MLGRERLTAFVATAGAERAKRFYGEALGLRLLSDDPYAIVFDAGGTTLRVQKVAELEPAPYTALGWQVADIVATMTALHARGVRFERYDFLEQDAAGVWLAPSGAKIAWFKDPDGNVLSLTEA